ncbi:MAG TPA: MFS transporter [Polyangiales bacterium]|nr:MFS transporter [Polyangiales bacterium]
MDTRVDELEATAAPGTVPRSSAGRYRWLVCSLLFFATTVNYIDRQILSLLKPILDDELHWSNAEFGQVNAAFQAAYAVGLLVFGKFIDRFGTKLGYGVSIAAWSLAAMFHAAVSSVAGFTAARLALGLGEGGNFPSAIKAVAVWFPRRERAFATALFNSGANVGAIIAPATIPWLAAAGGWHLPFLVAGVAGFVWLAFWQMLYDAPERVAAPRELAHIRADVEAPEQGQVGWGKLLQLRAAWAFILAKFLTDPVWWFFLIWLPDYFKKTRALDLKSSWLHLVSIYTIVTILSIAGGWLTGHWVRRGQSVSRARKTGMLLFACLVLPVLSVGRASDWGAVMLIGLAGAAHQAWSANLFTSVSDMFPKRAVASVVGLGGMAGSVGGIAFPIYAGKLLDRFEASGNVAAGYGVLFGICSSAYLIAFALHHLLAPKFEQIDARWE